MISRRFSVIQADDIISVLALALYALALVLVLGLVPAEADAADPVLGPARVLAGAVLAVGLSVWCSS